METDMPAKHYSVSKTFGIAAPEGLYVTGYEERGPYVPDIDPHYVFRRDVLRDVIAWLESGNGEGLYLTGPTGAGKSSILVQIAARINLPIQRAAGNSRLELADLIGQCQAVNGSTLFCPGPLTLAMKEGHLFLMDEIDLLDPGMATGLNPIVEDAPMLVPQTGELIKPHANFRFVATGNTAGLGDGTGLYQGTLRQNLAFIDRFWVVKVGYPEPLVEKEVLEREAPQLPVIERERMIEVANDIRRLFMGESDAPSAIEVTMSTRALVRWARLAVVFRGAPLSYSLDRALTFRTQPETREAILQVVQRHFGDDAIEPSSRASH
jgi:cobaltochelatase CobS